MDNEQYKKVEDILGSLDGVQKAVAPDFFYTRLKARMEKGFEPVVPKLWILRPVYAIAVLIIVIVINAAVIFNGQNNTGEDIVADTDTFQTIAAEYALNDNSANLYDLNQDK